MILPIPSRSRPTKQARCDQLLAELEEYLKQRAPLDRDRPRRKRSPLWVVDRLFKMGALGCTVPTEYGGLGFGITSYNRVLEMIGKYCGSTAVMVSAHQSIGCKAIMLFGDRRAEEALAPDRRSREAQRVLPQRTQRRLRRGRRRKLHCELSRRRHTLHASTARRSGQPPAHWPAIFTVMSRAEDLPNGKREASPPSSARQTWKASTSSRRTAPSAASAAPGRRASSSTNVKVPVSENLLHKEGKGLNVALTCLNYGRCTLSAGMTGGAKRAMDQSHQVGQHPLPVPQSRSMTSSSSASASRTWQRSPTRWTRSST